MTSSARFLTTFLIPKINDHSLLSDSEVATHRILRSKSASIVLSHLA